jgi:hypothetical protein
MAEGARCEDVQFRSDGLTLAGTLAVPESDDPAAVVLLLPGSGQTDRNDNAKTLAIDAFPPLAAALASNGFATFGYDKRGVGASEGDYWTSSFEDRLADAVAAVAWVRDRPEVDPSRVFAVGHSEGALVSIRLAAGAAPVAGAILLAGSVKTGEQTLTWQARQIAESLTGYKKWIVRLLRIDVTRSQHRAFARINADTAHVIRMNGRKINAQWMRQFLAYDPAADLARITVPVLAITGDRDIQVDPDDLDQIPELVHGPIRVLRLPGVTHLLRTEGTRRGLPGYKEQVRRPIDPRVITAITEWLKKNTNGNTH